MSTSETLFSFRTPYPDSLQRERDQVVTMEARRDGALVAPLVAGSSFSLFGPASTPTANIVIDAQPVTVVGDIATYAITAAELPDTLAFDEMYQERWVLAMPDGTTRTVPRETTLSPMPINPVVSVDDLTDDYPDLVAQLGTTPLKSPQNWLDVSWKKLIRKLFRDGRWPDVMLSTDAFFDPHLELTLFRIFRYLSRQTGGGLDENKWQKLWTHHEDNWEREYAGMRSRVDHDTDGLPDSANREASTSVVHQNVGPGFFGHFHGRRF